MYAARPQSSFHHRILIFAQYRSAQRDPSAIGTDIERAGMARQAPNIAADSFLQDPIRRALIAQSGGHLRENAARPVAGILYSNVNRLINIVDKTVCLIDHHGAPAGPMLGVQKIH